MKQLQSTFCKQIMYTRIESILFECSTAVYSTKSSVHLTNEHLRLALGHRRMFSIRSGSDRGQNERIELFVEFQTFTHDFEDIQMTFSTLERGEVTEDKFVFLYVVM
jgi:hypothetical protein